MDYNEPNTRQRIAARRMRRRPLPAVPGVQATPGLRATGLGWVKSGRLVSLLIFLGSVVALGYLFTDARFRVQHVQVEGQQALDGEVVVALSNLRGRSIWFIDTEAAIGRLKENAYIAAATVEVTLPDQALIRIVERRPEVRWTAGGVQYLVDATGKVLGPALESTEADVLVITDNSHTQLNPNDQVDSDAISLAQTLAIRLPLELGFTPAQLGWDYGLGVYVRTATDQTIVFGQSADLERKLAILDVLLREGTAFRYLDLRPSNPFYQE